MAVAARCLLERTTPVIRHGRGRVGVLLPQPHGFEPFPPRQEGSDSDDLPVAQIDVVGELLVEFKLACAALHVDVPQPENGLSEVAHRGLLEAKHVPYFPERGGRFSDFVAAAVDGVLDRGRGSRAPIRCRERGRTQRRNSGR